MPTLSAKTYLLVAGICLSLVTTAFTADAEESNRYLAGISLENLLNITITSASGTEETVANAPASLLIITAEDIYKRGYGNFNDIFADLPGFDAYAGNGDRPNKAFQRGYRQPYASRTLILLNGRVQNEIWGHYLNIERQIPMSRISRIEVLYGPVGVIYGPNAFLGVVNIITKTGADHMENTVEGSIQTSYGSYHTRDIEWGFTAKQDDFIFDIAGKLFDSDGPELNDFSSRYDFYNGADLANSNIWGPLLTGNNGGPFTVRGAPYGQYNDPDNQNGLFASLSYKSLRIFYNKTQVDMSYGMEYLSRYVQPHGPWYYHSDQWGVEVDHSFASGLRIKGLYTERDSVSAGTYSEAAENSYTSLSLWHSPSSSELFQLDGEYPLNDTWLFTGGIKYEKKSLPRGFEVCGYFNAFSPFCGTQEQMPGELGLGAGIFSPDSDNFVLPPAVSRRHPDELLADTTDEGIYGQAIYDKNNWRISAGIRYDDNNIYASTTNPRMSVIYRFNEQNTLKLLYGEAFQEPQPNLVFVAFSARAASEDVGPETLKNVEAIYIRQGEYWSHEFSAYLTRFEGVIQEEPIPGNLSNKREVIAAEYRGRFFYDNFIEGADAISGYVYYTYTDAQSDIFYSYDKDSDGNVLGWQNGAADTGDIAPHKFKAGIDLPLTARLSWNLRLIYHGETRLYGRNPLRTLDQKLDAYTLVNTNINWQLDPFTLSLKINNLFNESYYAPGDQGANGGNLETQAMGIAVGFYSSLLPQLERNYALSLKIEF
ncbi:TonB-dependent receptor plug domain-containing protein [Thalassomonas haliotis]|uniref:TonB-dependent receptor n=1 Tax=Thalassomonas haliotis TaxID=485448 RepID=A0ABY7V9R7_9GAMM|nr:TonB-dependent receptor [Thalassomonas haliotis]WDE09970.1 TonB-dependent receptor [Thalassomonas haliotis]